MVAKQDFRQRIWRLLEERGAARFPGARGRIPNFVGAEAAAERLADLPAWQRAGALKANPDSPQLPVRTRALKDGKVVFMAVPKLAEPRAFVLLDPARISGNLLTAASIKGAMKQGRPVLFGQMRRIDLVVCGTVAANRHGARIGKGGGYSDLEFALLTEATTHKPRPGGRFCEVQPDVFFNHRRRRRRIRRGRPCSRRTRRVEPFRCGGS